MSAAPEFPPATLFVQPRKTWKPSATTATTTRTRGSNRRWRSCGSRAKVLRTPPSPPLAGVARRSVQRYLETEFLAGGLARVRRLSWKGKANANWPSTRPPWKIISWRTPPRPPAKPKPPSPNETGVRRGFDPGAPSLKKRSACAAARSAPSQPRPTPTNRPLSLEDETPTLPAPSPTRPTDRAVRGRGALRLRAVLGLSLVSGGCACPWPLGPQKATTSWPRRSTP